MCSSVLLGLIPSTTHKTSTAHGFLNQPWAVEEEGKPWSEEEAKWSSWASGPSACLFSARTWGRKSRSSSLWSAQNCQLSEILDNTGMNLLIAKRKKICFSSCLVFVTSSSHKSSHHESWVLQIWVFFITQDLKTHHSHLKAFFKVHSRGAGETDELVKCLSRKHGDLSWIPKPTFFKS